MVIRNCVVQYGKGTVRQATYCSYIVQLIDPLPKSQQGQKSQISMTHKLSVDSEMAKKYDNDRPLLLPLFLLSSPYVSLP